MIENYPLPEGWRWVRLGEVCTINPSRPKNFSRSPNAPTTFVPMAAVDEKTGTIYAPLVVPYSKVSKGYTYFEEKDVLFAKITPCMQNGKHVIAKDLIDGIGFGTTEFHVLRSNGMVLPEWIHCFIGQPYFLQEATAYFTGAVGQQRIPEDFLINYVIPFPPLPEQKRIVAKLQELMQEAERARTACERQLEAAQSLPAAYLWEVFESEEAKRWERKRLGEVCEFLDSMRIPVNDTVRQKRIARKKQSELYPYYGANGQVGWIDGYLFDEELVLLAEDGGFFGSTEKPIAYRVSGKCWVNNHAHVLRPNKGVINVDWLYFTLAIRPDITQFVSGTTRPKLNQEQASLVPIPLPPLPSKQHRIAAKIQELMQEAECARTACERQLEAINTLPQVILGKAFRGGL